MKLTYIYHSGFGIECGKCVFIIDYYKDSAPKHGVVHRDLLKKKERLYVLSTHSHPDHFNPEILKWQSEREDIKYIFAKEIKESMPDLDVPAVLMEKGDRYEDEFVSIQAFGSTDIGISYLINVEGKIIFHAGDLNNWHWNEESTPEEIDEAETYYAKELDQLSQHVSHLDLAMFPVDARLGKAYMKGAEQFIKAIRTTIFAPMHFSESGYESAAAFADIAKRYGTKAICWSRTGETIEF